MMTRLNTPVQTEMLTQQFRDAAVRSHVISALILLTVISVGNHFSDPDLWWHLRVGQVIWDTRAIPVCDLFSFTTGGHAWTAHEWLAEVTIFASHLLGGRSGVMLWLCLIAAAVVICIYILCVRYSGDSCAGLIGAALGWFLATVGLAARPLLLGHLLLVIELLVLELGRTRNKRWLWALPPLFAIWVNCHGSFSLGLIVLGLATACAMARWHTGRLETPVWSDAGRKTLFLSATLTLPALFLNANGLRSLTYPFNVFARQKLGLALVQEWAPLNIQDPRGAAVFGLLAFLFLLVLLDRATLRVDEVLMVAGGACMAFCHARLVFAFGILAAPVVSRVVGNLLRPNHAVRNRSFVNAALAGLGVWSAVALFPGDAELARQERSENPQAAVEFIRRAGLKGPMLNDYNFGGYLIWSLPEHKVFVDGRSDVYEWAGVLEQYFRWSLLKEDPRGLLNKYGIGFCVLRANSPMSRVLALLPDWQEVHRDEVAVVFTRSHTSLGTPTISRSDGGPKRLPVMINKRRRSRPQASLWTQE